MRINGVSVCALICTLVCEIFNIFGFSKMYELDKVCTEPIVAYLTKTDTRTTSKNVGLTLQFVDITTAYYEYSVDNITYSVTLDFEGNDSIIQSIDLKYDKRNPSNHTYSDSATKPVLVINLITIILIGAFGCIVSYIVGILFR